MECRKTNHSNRTQYPKFLNTVTHWPPQINREVFDITPWVKKHPGGNLVYVKAGQDCTLLFDSYHMTKARYVPSIANNRLLQPSSD